MSSKSFSLLLNKIYDNRLMYLLISFFAIRWDTRRRVWAIADCAKMLLDMGCGYAHYTRSSKARSIIGVDLDKTALKEVYLYGKNKKFQAVFCDASVLPFKEHVFDTIIATEVLEHIPRDDLAVKEMHRVLREKGRLLITTPNGDYLPRSDRYHIRHYKEKEIILLLTPYFELRKIVKRFDKSLLIISCFTSLHGRVVRYIRRLGLTVFTGSRMDHAVLIGPFLAVLSPLVNVIVCIENCLESGKYNLVIECTRN